MKIMIGTGNAEEAREFLSRGVDELYFGFLGIDNHRPADLSFQTLEQVHEVIGIACAAQKKIFLAVNEVYPWTFALFLPWHRRRTSRHNVRIKQTS